MVDTEDLVATWNIPMSDRMHKIELEHGTTTGKRVIRVDGKEVIRRDWMFKLVGREVFEINGVRCSISIEAVGLFTYEYQLQVGNKAYERFRDQQKKTLQVWHVRTGEEDIRVCLEKDVMDVWVNTEKVNTTGEFLDDGGTKTHFEIPPNTSCFILSESSGNRHVGLVHKLYVNDEFINPSTDMEEN